MASADLRRAILVVGSTAAALLLLNGATGFVIFNHALEDPLQRADAVVVLSGDHDGREDYAIALARSGLASTVLISNTYPSYDPVMRRVCGKDQEIEVICLRPSPGNTRGEAVMTQRLATKRSWNKVIVVTWNYHLPRARLIFRQCFSNDPQSVVMRAVPRRYDFSPARWEFVYAYEYAGLMKAFIQGDCA
jgi:uncharacterized SAM-binding protein YcdF (DUF218 family)